MFKNRYQVSILYSIRLKCLPQCSTGITPNTQTLLQPAELAIEHIFALHLCILSKFLQAFSCSLESLTNDAGLYAVCVTQYCSHSCLISISKCRRGLKFTPHFWNTSAVSNTDVCLWRAHWLSGFMIRGLFDIYSPLLSLMFLGHGCGERSGDSSDDWYRGTCHGCFCPQFGRVPEGSDFHPDPGTLQLCILLHQDTC